jgi:hypothetical protein
MGQPFVSGIRAWTVRKNVQIQPVVVDCSKRTMDYDGKRFWIRFETQDKFYIYSLTPEKKEGAQ